MDSLKGRHILVGVGGSIAAHRALDLVRDFRAAGATVRVAPTAAARAFVSALAFEALSGKPILSTALDVENGTIPHIEEAYRADAVVVAPATADLLARMAMGLGDEALLTMLLSFQGPLVVAPAMETRMWSHPATRAHVDTLQARGALFVGPVAGPLASGRSGLGRLAEVSAILSTTAAALSPQDWAGRRVLLTVGPTIEDLDPVRYLTNRSSGKMGFAIAAAALRRGADVVLVQGPTTTTLPSHPRLSVLPVRRAVEMHDAVMRAVDGPLPFDCCFLVAAVADYQPAMRAPEKIKKDEDTLTLTLTRTPDILAELGARTTRPYLVGFAAETGNAMTKARQKRARKGCDLICVNDVLQPGVGFESDDNELVVIAETEDVALGRASKEILADRLLDVVKPRLSPR